MPAAQDNGSADIARDPEAVAAALAAALGGEISGLRRLTGGASLESWVFTHQGARRILRRRAGRASDVLVNSLPLADEASLLRLAQQAGVAVPALLRVCPPADGLGEAYIVAFVEGETLGKRIVGGEGFARARSVLARQCGEALARIHAIPRAGLPALKTLDAEQTLAQYEAIHRGIGGVRPVIEAALRYFAARLPPAVPACLLHGDFRSGNLMVAPDDAPSPGLAAVLDWELAHFGDPAEDLGWLCVNSWRFGKPALPVGGFGVIDDLLAGYHAAGGAPVSAARLRFWQGVGSLKWAVMCEMMYAAYATGADRSMERAAIGRRVSECEGDLIALMREGF